MNKFTSMISALAFVAIFSGQLGATERQALGDKPSKTCKEILDSISKKEYSRLKDLAIDPVCEACVYINQRFNVDLKAEFSDKLKKGEYDAMKSTAIKFVYYDMKNIFALVRSEEVSDVAVAVELIKCAYADYFAVSQEVQNIDMVRDWKFKKMFTNVFAILSSSGYTDKSVVLNGQTKDSVKAVCDKIELAMTESFPALQ